MTLHPREGVIRFKAAGRSETLSFDETIAEGERLKAAGAAPPKPRTQAFSFEFRRPSNRARWFG